ncbi:methylated-DNA--[protein]-cysteine S-methyltransferase [Lactobacillus sp.]|uniref:methylated-DNA--[protein]-cysteine S-methyltransferase n=1 Tax=Lactobacillus sp. TaxID=1591 RepID=UPI003EF29EC2
MTGYAIYDYPFGQLKIGYEDNIITLIGSVKDEADLKQQGPKTPLTDQVFQQITEYLDGKRKTFTFSYRLSGTPFQEKVWHALEDIPYGETRSYKEVAEAIGNPKAVRAIGGANHKNPIMIAVPCHRVLGADGSLTGYAGGIAMKQALLELEKKNK